ncbi:unnamed protein product [Rotaria sp. Silwood2]|nr:unnamed protein product [Rotaria sp. Silwood2]
MVECFIWICILLISAICSSSHGGDDYNIDGMVVNEWEFVRDSFKENFVEQRDLGASIAIYHQGKLVVDLWGGWFDRSFTKPYDNNTLQLVFSATKGLLQNIGLNMDKMAKENTTVADILSQRAGLPFISDPSEQIFNWTAMIHSLEHQRPLWPPGTAHSYHALTYGWLAGELIRRVDPKKRTVWQFIQDEIANPFQIEFYIGLPLEQAYRVSPLTLSLDDLRAMNDSMKAFYILYNDPRLHRAEIPAANGITSAKSLARIYASLITNLDDGKQKRLLDETVLNQATKLNTPKDELDFITNTHSAFGMGFTLFDQTFPMFKSKIFGHIGAGGSIGFAVPSKNLSFAYVVNQLDMTRRNPTRQRIQKILEKVSTKITADY